MFHLQLLKTFFSFLVPLACCQMTMQPLKDLITADPGLPHPHPTDPYWLSDPHPLAEVQSQSLPQTADIVIIGSGITGVSIALHALGGKNGTRVAVLEARALCSGATGRNGGHAVTPGATLYSSLKGKLGQELAYKLLNFTFTNVDEIGNVARHYAPKESEYRSVERIHCYGDDEAFQGAKASILEYERDYPEEIGKYALVEANEAREKYGIHGIAGAARFAAGALWPYRLIMKIWETLLQSHPETLTIDANTPATSVSLDSTDHKYKYLVQTPRGLIRASKVVYATNAYTGHLLPAIRGLLYPFKESMTVQDLEHNVPNRGNTTTWSLDRSPVYNKTDDRTATGSLYLQQNAFSGLFFWGGAYVNPGEALTPDDSTLAPKSTPYLQQELSSFFGQNQAEENRLVSEWTGIQGYTSDEMPLVGPLPESLTGRPEGGEWIAAGYNGGGMAFCWMAGKAIAGMMRGEDVSAWFPEILIPSMERLATSLTVNNSLANMEELFVENQG